MRDKQHGSRRIPLTINRNVHGRTVGNLCGSPNIRHILFFRCDYYICILSCVRLDIHRLMKTVLSLKSADDPEASEENEPEKGPQ